MLPSYLEKITLFKECVEALKAEVLSLTESNQVLKLFQHQYPLTEWGKVNWDTIKKKIYIGPFPDKIVPALEKIFMRTIDKSVYIEWSCGSAHTLKTDLDSIVTHFDDVTCVAVTKFIFNPSEGYIIEILPGDDITIGRVMPFKTELMVLTREVREASEKLKKTFFILTAGIEEAFVQIRQCDNLNQTQIYFDLLQKVQIQLSELIKDEINISKSLHVFMANFEKLDDLKMREYLFDQIKKGKFNCI